MADGILKMRLAENQKVTLDNVYRSEAELSKFDQDLLIAEKNGKVAAAWFNFLLNRPLDDSISLMLPDIFPSVSSLKSDYTEMALENREELEKLKKYGDIAEMQVKMNQSSMVPDLFVAVDYGFQGEEYRFNKEQDYMQASAVLTWKLFEGFSNKAKIRQSIIDREIIEDQLEEARKHIELQVITVLSELRAADRGITAAEARLRNAAEGYRLVNRKFNEGQASLIEYIDARNTLTNAEENLIMSKYSYLSCYAEFEKVLAIKTF